MATVTEDLINGAQSEVTQAGQQTDRSFLIEGLTRGTSNADKAGLWEEVYTVLRGIGVDYGLTHPFNPALICSRVKPMPFANNSKTAVRVIATYVMASGFAASGSIIRFRAWTERIWTSRYFDKTLILVSYTPPGSGASSAYPSQIGRVPGTKAVGKLIIEQERSSDPEPLLVCINKLNLGTYRGQAEGSFLCTAINIDPTGTGKWRVVFEADYDEHLHSETAFYTNPATGEPYPEVIGSVGAPGTFDPNVADGNGWENVQVQDLINFGSFGF